MDKKAESYKLKPWARLTGLGLLTSISLAIASVAGPEAVHAVEWPEAPADTDEQAEKTVGAVDEERLYEELTGEETPQVAAEPAGASVATITEDESATDRESASAGENTTEALLTETSPITKDVAKAPVTLEDYQQASATELAAWVKDGRVTPEELVDMAFEMMDAHEKDLNAVITTRKDLALEELAAMKAEIEKTGEVPPFYGVPILVKGLGPTVEGGINSNGLKFMKDNVSKSTHSFIKAFQKAGFLVLGQTSYPQSGLINVTNSDLYGVTHNPWDLSKNPGGSSGGSAAAVAMGYVPIATSSDAGGSSRIPGSFSGLIGFHPTAGVVQNTTDKKSGGQTTHFAMTHDMADSQALFNILLKDGEKKHFAGMDLNYYLHGEDGKADRPIAYTLKTPAGTPLSDAAKEAVLNAVAFLKKQGYKVEEVNYYPVNGQRMMEAYYTFNSADMQYLNYLAETNLKRPLQKDDVELLAWGLVQAGKNMAKEYVGAADAYVSLMKQQMDTFYDKYAFLITPTTAEPAPAADYHHMPEKLKPLMADMSGLRQEEKIKLIYDQWLPAWTKTPFTQLANLTGTPSLTLPTYLTPAGLPLGVLFNGPKYADQALLQLGKIFQDKGQLINFYRTMEKLVEKDLPYGSTTQFTPDLLKGEKKLLKPGQVGKMLERWQVKYAGNDVTGKTLLSSEKTVPVDAVWLVGTGVKEEVSAEVEALKALVAETDQLALMTIDVHQALDEAKALLEKDNISEAEAHQALEKLFYALEDAKAEETPGLKPKPGETEGQDEEKPGEKPEADETEGQDEGKPAEKPEADETEGSGEEKPEKGETDRPDEEKPETDKEEQADHGLLELIDWEKLQALHDKKEAEQAEAQASKKEEVNTPEKEEVQASEEGKTLPQTGSLSALWGALLGGSLVSFGATLLKKRDEE